MEMDGHGALEKAWNLRSAIGILGDVGHKVVGVPLLQCPHPPAAGLPALVCMAGGGI
jgi:hypothetical protein